MFTADYNGSTARKGNDSSRSEGSTCLARQRHRHCPQVTDEHWPLTGRSGPFLQALEASGGYADTKFSSH